MAQYDEKLNRMLFLMEDKKSPATAPKSNVVTYRTGADGNIYGIIREGTKFYIKTTEQGKENLSESYEYLGGFNERRHHEYKSVNDASRHLVQEMINLNAKYGVHEDVDTVDFKAHEKALTNLTEAARAEIDRVHQIFENSFISTTNVGNHGDSEKKGTSTGADTVKNNEPFEVKVSASLDKDPKFSATVKGATPDNKEVAASVEADLQSDKMKKANSGSEKDYKDAHDDLDGESVADKKPAGGKVTHVNESMFEDSKFFHNDAVPDNEQLPPFPDEINLDLEGDDFLEGEPVSVDSLGDENIADGGDEGIVGMGNDDDSASTDLSVDDFDEETPNLEEMINEFEANLGNANKNVISGDEETLVGKSGNLKVQTWDKMDESEGGNVNDPAKAGTEEFMKSYEKKGTLPTQSWDKMNSKKVDEMVDTIYGKLLESAKAKKVMKENLQQKIQRIVNEEVTRLNAWGKHPRFGQEPMTLPADKEVLAGTADRDFNDDSAKHNTRYAQKIGKGTPFDEKVLDMLTDQVMAQLKENRNIRRK